jgi:hypothetical protein
MPIQLSRRDAENYKMYLKNCFSQDEEIKTLYIASLTDNSIRGTIRTKFFKQWFLCALEKFNSFPSNNRINKERLYTALFTYGFPMGFIAKVLLDGNLGPIRNAILKYKSDIKNILENRAIVREGFLSDVVREAMILMQNSTTTPLEFYKMLLDTCYVVGGLGLARKLTNSEDIASFIANYPEAFDGSIDNQPMFGYGVYPRSARRYMADLESDASGERGQRRTGQTTSREVVGRRGSVSRDIVLPTPLDVVTIERQIIPERTSAIVTQTPPPAPAQPRTPRSAQSTTLVRNMPFTNAHSVGIELEYFGPTRPALIKALKNYGVECIDDRYGHSVPRTFKIVQDGSLTNSNSPNNDELVSPPMFGIRGLTLVKRAFMGIRDAGVLVNQEGGLHVHFGAKNNGQVWDMKTWENLIRNYNGLQPIIDVMLHAGRRNSQGWAKNLKKVVEVMDRDYPQGFSSFQDILRCYCRGNLNSIGRPDPISETTQSLTNPRNHGRYHAINPFAFINQTTCEFRQSGPTTETDTTMNWIWFLHFLIELSKRKTLTVFNWANVENFLPLSLATFWANRIWDLSPDSNELKKEIQQLRESLNIANQSLPRDQQVNVPRQRVDDFSQNIAKDFLNSSNRG